MATATPQIRSLDPVGVFKALGHPARVTMVRELAVGERCVCELVQAAGLGWSTVSRHLAVLRDAGVVSHEKRGLQVFYRLELPCVTHFIRCLEAPATHPELMRSACECR
ncbi:MAG: metalloregulator ArsR/SmtB family transcription factor [Gammaproteobacteria bacterium]